MAELRKSSATLKKIHIDLTETPLIGSEEVDYFMTAIAQQKSKYIFCSTNVFQLQELHLIFDTNRIDLVELSDVISTQT